MEVETNKKRDRQIVIKYDSQTKKQKLQNETNPLFDKPKWGKYKRPQVVIGNSIAFQKSQIDYIIGEESPGISDRKVKNKVPIIRLFGVTREGNSVQCNVHNFYPYFYLEWKKEFEDGDCKMVKKSLKKWNKEKNGDPKDGNEIVSIEKILANSIVGHDYDKKETFLKITFSTPKVVTKYREALEKGIFLLDEKSKRNTRFMTYESDLAFVVRFMVNIDLVGMGWLEIKKEDYTLRTGRSSCQIEIDVSWEKITSHKTEKQWAEIAPLRILSFDIECAGRKGVFPEPKIDPVIQISNIIYVQGNNPEDYLLKNVFVLRGSTPLSNGDIHCFRKETELLLEWRNFIEEVDPDILIGYNIENFDLKYLFDRSKALNIDNAFLRLGKVKKEKAWMKDKPFSSKAYGTLDLKECHLSGRATFDILNVIQREHKLRSYTLNSVSAFFLGEQKDDIKHTQISVLYNGSDSDRSRLAHYCLRDSILPLKLVTKLMCIFNYCEMARVTGVPFDYLLSKGQQIKVTSQIYRKAKTLNLLIPHVVREKSIESDESYEGATVFEPKKGFYPRPIATLDFASLYPSIMMAKNMCYSTLLKPHELKNFSPDQYETTTMGHCFIKEDIKKGVLPMILKELLDARQKAKDELKIEKDPFKKAVLDGRQLALKVSANSVYGYTGATIGKLPCLEISSSVTAYGREVIQQTAKIVKGHYNKQNGYLEDCEIIYGDSVTEDTPILCKLIDGSLVYRTIDQLAQGEWEKDYHNDKEEAEPIIGIRVWTEHGFTPIKRVIRHKTQKKILRVLTHTGCVDVTEDHSLLTPSAEKIRPVDVSIGTKLLHNSLPKPQESRDFGISEDQAYAWGLFLAEGSCGKKSSWAISNLEKSLLEKVIPALELTEKECTFKILESSGAYKLVACGKVVPLVKKFRKLFYDHRAHKIIPDVILNSKESVRRGFWNGYYAEDGDQDNVRCDIKGKIGAAGLYFLASSLGYPISINDHKDKRNIFRLTATRKWKRQRKDPSEIKKIHDFGVSNVFVYDLETENHHFSAGVGQMIVHNTDSIMVDFKILDRALVMQLAKEAADMVTKTINKNPMKIVFEKVYDPYLLVSKKRYAGVFYTKVEKYDKIECKGIESVRRDSCPLVARVIQTSVNTLLIDRNVEAAKQFVKKTVSELLMDKIDISELIISRSMSKPSEQYKSKQPHTELAKKMNERNPGSGYSTGDRAKYVMINAPKKTKNFEMSEDPVYVIENDIPVNFSFYLENQLKKPVTRIFEPIIDDVQSLFVGDHTRHRVNNIPKTGGILGFVVQREVCLSCKGKLDTEKKTVCSRCEDKEADLYLEKITECSKLEKDHSKYWTQCQKCQGSLTKQVICDNDECPIFFRRQKAKKELGRVSDVLKKFQLSW